jgi:hypothetical protein
MRKIVNWSQFSLVMEAIIEPDTQGLPADKKEYSRQSRNKMEKALQELVAKAPWFGEFATKLDLRQDWNLQFNTMATNGYEILYDPEFVCKTPYGEVVWIIAHEVMHCVLRHHERRQIDHLKWNAACDYALNQLLVPAAFSESMSYGEKSTKTPTAVKMPIWALGGEKDTNPYKDKFIGKNAEQIYQFLLNNNIQLPPESGWNYGGVNPAPLTPPKKGDKRDTGGQPSSGRKARVGDYVVLSDGSYGIVAAIDGSTGDCDIDPLTEQEMKDRIESIANKKIKTIR